MIKHFALALALALALTPSLVVASTPAAPVQAAPVQAAPVQRAVLPVCIPTCAAGYKCVGIGSRLGYCVKI